MISFKNKLIQNLKQRINKSISILDLIYIFKDSLSKHKQLEKSYSEFHVKKEISNNLFLILNLKNEIEDNIYYDKYELHIYNFIKSYVKQNMNIIIVGGHIGYYPILLSELILPNGKVYSFEPDQENYSRCSQHIYLNKINNIVNLNYSISNIENDNVDFYEFKDSNKGHGSIFKNEFINKSKSSNYEIKKVKTRTLDQIIFGENLANIDLLLIDIEGAEYECLEGAKNTLDKYKPLIIFEYHYERIDFLKKDHEKIFQLLSSYNLYGINMNGLKKLNKIEKDQNFHDIVNT